jgi:hypothetical protein
MKLMKSFFAFLFALISYTSFSQNQIQPIAEVNSVIGDDSFLLSYGVKPDAGTDNRMRITTHLKYVENALRAKEVAYLPEHLKQRRIQMLDFLKEYIDRGLFPKNEQYAKRVPCFIDDYGTICAVGYLVEKSVGREYAEEINTKYQYNYIKDMDDPFLLDWMSNSGLTLEELGMIQPTYYSEKKRNSIYIGPSIGINLSGIRERDFLADHKRRLGPRMGIQLEKKWDKGQSLALEFLMQKKGYRHNITFTDEEGKPTGESATLDFEANYISLPIKGGINLFENLGAYINIGVVPSLLLSSQLETPEIVVDGLTVLPAEVVEMNDKLNKFDLAVLAELGYNIRYQVFLFNFNLAYDRSLTRFNNYEYFPEAKAWHTTLSASVGLKYRLKYNF